MTTELTYRNGVPQYTLLHYERDFADRHLLHEVILKWAREKPDHVAIIEFDTGNEYTYRQFDNITTAIALRLVELGFRPGDFFATSLPLTAEHVLLEYACFKIGVIHTPLDLRLKAPEVIRSLKLVEPKGYALLGKTPVADFNLLGMAVKSECPSIEHYLQFAASGSGLEGTIAGSALFADATSKANDRHWNPSTEPAWQEFQRATKSVHEADGAQVIYTTGSTGFPKPALLSHRNITCQNMCMAGGFDILDDPIMLVNLPPSHVGCQAEQLMTTFFAGGTAVILHIFDAEKSLQAIEQHQINSFGQIPALFAMQWRLPNYKDYNLSSLQFALYGGQQVSRQFLEQLSSMAPKFGTGLGLSEMAGFVTYSPMDGTVDDLLVGVGYDMPATPLTIRKPMNDDGTAGDELPDGDAGEICFSGPQVFIDYVNNRDAYQKTVSKEGICYTGDLGYKTEKGLMFSGRSKLVIKPKGYQVHPGQVEQHFALLTEKVASCAAVGVAHEVFTEAIILFVEQKPDAAVMRDDLETHAKDIAAYMRPSHYVILPAGELPLNRIAKTDYVELKQRATEEVERLRASGGWDS